MNDKVEVPDPTFNATQKSEERTILATPSFQLASVSHRIAKNQAIQARGADTSSLCRPAGPLAAVQFATGGLHRRLGFCRPSGPGAVKTLARHLFAFIQVFDRIAAPNCLSPTLTRRGRGDKKHDRGNVEATCQQGVFIAPLQA